MQKGTEGGWMGCPKEHGKRCQYKHREGKTSPKESVFAYEFKIAYKVTQLITVMQLSLEETQQLHKKMQHRALQQFSMYEVRAAPEPHRLNTGWKKKKKAKYETRNR